MLEYRPGSPRKVSGRDRHWPTWWPTKPGWRELKAPGLPIQNRRVAFFQDAASRRTGGTRPPTGELHSRSVHHTRKRLRPPGLGETSLERPPKALRQPLSRQRSPDPGKTMPARGGGLTWAESVGRPGRLPSDLFLKRRPELEAAVDGPLAADGPAAADLIAPSRDRFPPPLSAISRPDFSTRPADFADERQRGDPYVSGEVRAMAPGSPGSPSPPHQPVATPDTAAARCPWQRHSDPPTGRSTAAWRSLPALP